MSIFGKKKESKGKGVNKENNSAEGVAGVKEGKESESEVNTTPPMIEDAVGNAKFTKLWSRRILDILKKDISMHPKLRDYNFYSNGYGTYSGKDNITFYYTIDGYPKEVPIDLRYNIRRLVRGDVKISFISVFEPTRIDWNSPRMASKLRTWRSIDEEAEDVDEFNYQENVESMDSMIWRKQSLVYLSDAEKRRNRKTFRYRSMMLVSGSRGENFDKTIFEVTSYCKNISLKLTRVDSDLFKFMRYFSPFSMEYSDSVVKKVGSNTVTDELLARFTTYDQGKIGRGGDYWGTDIYSGFPVYKRMKKDSVDAENILITAETGGGKSYYLKVLLLQLISKDNYNGTINDIEGFEYIPFAGFLANQDDVVILNMAEGQGCYFDPVEINLTGNEDLDKDMYSFSNSFTLALIKTLLGKNMVTNDWANVVVNNAVSRVYSEAGVDAKDMSTWGNSEGLTLYDVYDVLKDLYDECIDLIANYGYSIGEVRNLNDLNDESDLEITQQYRRNPKYKEALDLVIAKLSSYFEDLENGGIRSNVFNERVTLEDIRRSKLVICSFGMAGKSPAQVDPIQMGLAQLSASCISHIRSIFSKAEGKFNFKVWEEFQRWGSFPDADAAIQTALTGGRKLGDINFIITNDVKQLLDNDRFGVFGNITSFAVGAIGDDDTREDLCRRLSIPLLKGELDRLVTEKGNTETFEKDIDVVSIYDKAFLVHLDKSVSTIVKMSLPDYLSKSDIFRTGVNIDGGVE